MLTTAYFPPIDFFVAAANSKSARIESCEIFQKQSYRNRCNILSANGVLALSIPLRRGGEEHTHKLPIREIKIDYSVDWIAQHERAMQAAYMNSPFFIYYKDDLFSILESRHETLFELNKALIDKLLYFCSIKNNISYTKEYVATDSFTSNHECNGEGIDHKSLDLRETIHPKYKGDSFLQQIQMIKPYWQVFTQQGFIHGLSIVDLLFNEGPNSISFLKI